MAHETILAQVWETIDARREALERGVDPKDSRTMTLLSRGASKAAQKFGEEAVECLIEAAKGRKAHLVEESADMLYHWLVMLAACNVEPERVWAELEKRHGLPEAQERAGRLSD